MPGSFKGTKPGSHLDRTRTGPGGPSRVARLFAFREVLYTRMEEISFRTSMTVLGGVVAFAAVIAAVSTLMSLSPGPARPAALSGPQASAAPSSAPASPRPASPSPSASPSSGPPSVTPSPVRDTGPSAGTHAPVTAVAAASAPSATVPAPALSPSPARVSEQAAAAAWWAWWLRVYGRGGDRAYGGSGRDRGGFGGDGFGRR